MSRPTTPGGSLYSVSVPGGQTLADYIREIAGSASVDLTAIETALSTKANAADIASAVTTGAVTTGAVTAGVITVTGSPKPTAPPQATQKFAFGNMNNSISFPVPSLRPDVNSGAATQNIAFDIVPKGSAANLTDFFTNGVAWLDICNRDIVDYGGLPFNAAHLGVMYNGDVVLSSTKFNSASVANIRFEMHGVVQAQVNKTGGFLVGTGQPDTVQGELAIQKNASSTGAPGAGFAKLALLPGTNAGTAKLVIYAGTSTTPVVLADNIGAGV